MQFIFIDCVWCLSWKKKKNIYSNLVNYRAWCDWLESITFEARGWQPNILQRKMVVRRMLYVSSTKGNFRRNVSDFHFSQTFRDLVKRLKIVMLVKVKMITHMHFNKTTSSLSYRQHFRTCCRHAINTYCFAFFFINRETLNEYDYFSKQKRAVLIDSMTAISLTVKHIARFAELHATNKSHDGIEKLFHETIRVSNVIDRWWWCRCGNQSLNIWHK